MITVERLDIIEQDLKWARDNADRSAQTRLFIHHVPFLLTILRPVAEELDAMILEEEEYLAEESTEGATDSESETETISVDEKVKEVLSSSDETEEMTYREAPESKDATESQSTDDEVDERTDKGSDETEEATE